MFGGKKPYAGFRDFGYANFQAFYTFERRFLPWLGGGVTVFQQTIIFSGIAAVTAATNWYNYKVKTDITEWTIGVVGFIIVAGVLGTLLSLQIDKGNAEYGKTQFQFVYDLIWFKLRSGQRVNGRRVKRRSRFILINFHHRSRQRRRRIGAS